MGYGTSNDAYNAPRKQGPLLGHGGGKLDYLRAFQYITENPKWISNVLLLAVCILIPIVGPIVALGYQFHIVATLHLTRGSTYPDFDFGKFGDYLSRGIWPFLVALICQVIFVPLVLVMYFALVLCTGFFGVAQDSAGQGLSTMVVVLAAALGIVTVVAFSILAMIILTPMNLAAGLSGELGPAFNIAFLQDFIAKMWQEMILVAIAMIVGSLVLSFLGLLAFCIGVYASAAATMLAHTHFLWQLYELYLSRGGMRIPIKPFAGA